MPGRFKHYRVVGLIGQGGMGTVYEGVDERVGGRVAIKVLHGHLAAADPTFTERFEREAHVAALLRSPYTVHLHDFGVEDGRYFLVMEYIEGNSLSDYLQQGPLDANRALWVAGEVSRALEEAQARGIVHRDIKPDNILFDRDGRVKVTDFGIARSMNSGGVTVAGGFVGTPAYAAPEQVDGNVDHRSDIYAVGITLYAMLTGRPPYEGATPMDTLLQHRMQPLPTQALAHLPHSVQSIVRRATEKDPLDRYQSAAELAGAIDRARQTLSREGQQAPGAPPVAPVAATQAAPSAPARPAAPSRDEATVLVGSGGPTPSTGPALAAASAPPPASPPKKRKNVVYFYAGGMVVAILAAIGIAIALSSGGDGGGGGAADGGESPSPAASATTVIVASAADYEVTAIDFSYDRATLAAPPNTAVTYTFINEGGARHSLQFRTAAGGPELAAGATGAVAEPGQTNTVTFTTPAAGTYYFECVNHPTRMNGAFEVKEGAPAPPAVATGTVAAGAADPVTVDISATDFTFSQDTIEAGAGAEVTINFTNNDQAPHSVQFRTEPGGPELVAGSTGERVTDGANSFTFTAPGPGSYHFECGVHPGQMNGSFVVKAVDTAAATSTPTPPEPVAFNLIATDFAFDFATLEAEAGGEVTVTLKNDGQAPHSIQFRPDQEGAAPAPDATGARIGGGETDTFTFTAPGPGAYRFECGVHPGRMNGAFIVTAPGGEAQNLPSVTPPVAISRLSSGAEVEVVQATRLTRDPTTSSSTEVFQELKPGDRLIVVTNTPPNSTFHQTEGLLFWRVVVKGTQIVGWVPEVAIGGEPRFLDVVD